MYTSQISVSHPGCLLYLVDQSASMNDGWITDPTGLVSKSELVCDAINRVLAEQIMRATRGSVVRNWFDVGILGYSTNGNGFPVLESLFDGTLAGRTLVTLSELSKHPLDQVPRELPVGLGATFRRRTHPVWIKPRPGCGTPMRAAIERCYEILGEWIVSHPYAYPPIVINLTEGESSDGDPCEAANALMRLDTGDGNVLLLNCSLGASVGPPVLYAADRGELPDSYAGMLFDMSSELPERTIAAGRSAGLPMRSGSRGLVYNAGAVDLVSFMGLLNLMDIGTIMASDNR